jgi:transcriptional regulator with XRE-family HTH domain
MAEKRTGDPNLAERVKTLRATAKISQEELAELADVSPSMIQAIEQGTKFGSPKTHQKLATILNVSADYLTYGDTSKELSQALIRPKDFTDEDWQMVLTVANYIRKQKDKAHNEAILTAARERAKTPAPPDLSEQLGTPHDGANHDAAMGDLETSEENYKGTPASN